MKAEFSLLSRQCLVDGPSEWVLAVSSDDRMGKSFYKGLLPSPKALPSCLVASQRPHLSGLSQWIPSSNLNLQKTMKNENNPPKRTNWSSTFLISKGTLKQICAADEVEYGV